MPKWEKKLLAVFLEFDYGSSSRGPSLERIYFYENLKNLVADIKVFWYDHYLNKIELLQKDLIAEAQNYKPDLIFFIPYTDQFTFETLAHLKNKYTTYAWFGDDQWRFESYSSKYAPYFSFVSTTDPWSVSKYKKIGISPILTQWAGQLTSKLTVKPGVPDKFKYDVTFVGGYNEFRGWFIKTLATRGVKVECFGSGWPNGRISFQEMEDIFRLSKINLNLSNSVTNDIRFICSGLRSFARWAISPKRNEQIKARNFEIPLAGGFQLSNYVLGLERYLEIGREIAVYTSPEECIQQIEYYLENEDQRRLIISNSFQRCVQEHTYFQRLEKILEGIWGKKI